MKLLKKQTAFLLKATALIAVAFFLVLPNFSAEDAAPSSCKEPVTVPPNTVKGVRHQAKDGDFALLRGKFTQQKGNELFSFTDDGRHFIDVRFDSGSVPDDFVLNGYYYLWGQMHKNFGDSKYLQAVFLSPRPGSVRLEIQMIQN